MVRQALLDRTRPLATASEVLQADIAEHFETETAPDGTKWDDWAESYKPVAEEYPNVGILRQSEGLYEAATSSEAIVITKDAVFYRTAALPHYGLGHESGIPERKNPLPQRSFLGMSDEAQMIVYGNFIDWFDDSINLYVTARGRIGRRHALRGAGGMFIPRG